MIRDAFFVDAPGGPRYCLLTRPVESPVGCLVFAPPFAEELNKSRRMIALASHAFASAGWAVIQLDPLGCGDSSGDFGDASWATWLEDLSLAWSIAQREFPESRCGMWALRAGALLVTQWLASVSQRPPLLLWQPVVSGRQHLTQFLRLKAANSMLDQSDARAVTGQVRKALANGDAIEVAGYTLDPSLASGLELAELALPADYSHPVCVMEVSSAQEGRPSPAISRWASAQAQSNIMVRTHVVQGAAFWQTQEIESVPALIDASVATLTGWCA